MKVPPYLGWPLLVTSGYGMLCFWASRAVYYPMKHPQGYWDLQAQLGASDVWLRSSDGVKIHGWFIPAKQSTGTRKLRNSGAPETTSPTPPL